MSDDVVRIARDSEKNSCRVEHRGDIRAPSSGKARTEVCRVSTRRMVSGSGCQAGGTHFTEHENYRRITYDSVADAWTVEGKDGTRRQYTSVWTLSSVTHRWGLTSVTDTLGNTVTYGWWNDAGKNLYPSDVTYNSYQVKIFYRSDPTDRIAFATGLSLGATRQLIRSIQVGLDDGTPIRAYELEYSTSSSTGRSRLDSGREGRRDDHRLRRGLPEFPRR